MAIMIINFACTERSKSGELKSARATLGSKVRTYKNFASSISCWGGVGGNCGSGDKAGHCHSPPACPRDAAQVLLRLGLRVSYCISFSNLEICYKCISDKN